MRIDGDGELIDPWGTPFFFHQLSEHHAEQQGCRLEFVLDQPIADQPECACHDDIEVRVIDRIRADRTEHHDRWE